MNIWQPRFRLLGPLEIRLDGLEIALTGRQRALCSLLLVSANRSVSVDRLVQGLLGDRPRGSSAARVRALVAEIRRAFGVAGRDLLVTENSGYAMKVAPADIDIYVFESLIKDGARSVARGAWTEAYSCYDDAASLWRGDPFPDLSTSVEAERRRLVELHGAALEGRAQADLELGRYGAAIAELIRLSAEYPLREHPHALLMRALQRDGRTSEALEVYLALRGRLSKELGVEPSGELSALHQRLLAGVDSIATTRHAATPEHSPRDARVPHQLPRGPRFFVGRGTDVHQLDAWWRDGEDILLIVGPAGVGKTALALHWSHQVARGFPDGQLFLDMRGFDDGEPMTVEEALPLLLQGLGIAPRDVPVGLEAQTALYRTLLAERRVLIVLDDVADAALVRRLLPTSGGSLTLVTSRHKLSGLVTMDSAHRLMCDVLAPGAALELLSNSVGSEVVAADPEAANRLISLCDRLPLALCVAGSWIGGRPGSISSYVDDLAERGRLARLHVEGEESVAVRAALDLSYATLSDEASRVFRSLGLIPGTGRSVAAVAAGALLNQAHVEDLLRCAQQVHLLRDTDRGRATWHDLVHEYARERALTEDNESDRRAAVERILDHYLQSAISAAEACKYYVPHVRPEAVEGSSPQEFCASGEAISWFDNEWDGIAVAIGYAAEHGPYRFAWQLVDAMQDLFHHRRPLSDWVRLASLARKGAERGGDYIGQAAMGLALGHARWRDGDFKSALREYENCERLARRAGWLFGEAVSLQGRGVTLKLLGQPHEAPPYYKKSLAIYRRLGRVKSVRTMLINMASLYLALGQLADAENAAVEGLSLLSQAGDHTHAMCLVSLGLVRQKQARFDEAVVALRASVIAAQNAGSIYAEAVALEALGRVRDDTGQGARAIQAFEDAMTLAERVGNRNCQVDCLIGLASVKARAGLTHEAATHLGVAREMAEQTGYHTGLIEILCLSGVLNCARERYDDAIAQMERASDMAESGNPLTLPRVRTAVALALLRKRENALALAAATEAVDLAKRSGQRLLHARALMAMAAAHSASGENRSAEEEQSAAQSLFEQIGVPHVQRVADSWRVPMDVLEPIDMSRRPQADVPEDAHLRLEIFLARHFD
ncbi:AfsR/SARP family transcriptional regulator [Streptomyces pseudovenezuelae]|uniref:NB-ARC domain-containing protein n=1 Tax=Streptomyces pseudovenezuelae TaxID=67350 RepID=A0ABZ1X2B3_9ACTN|nr:BTAD domain-containing putative transcriptional regulator [Streptomyces pseudovenezuelae]